jgi:hypothetical protein
MIEKGRSFDVVLIDRTETEAKNDRCKLRDKY